MTTEPYRERTIIDKLNALDDHDHTLTSDEKLERVLGLIAIELAGIGDSLEHWRTKAERGDEYPTDIMVSS